MQALAAPLATQLPANVGDLGGVPGSWLCLGSEAANGRSLSLPLWDSGRAPKERRARPLKRILTLVGVAALFTWPWHADNLDTHTHVHG